MTGTEAAASLVTQQLDEGIAAWAELARQVAEPTVREQVEAAGRVVVAALQSGRTLLVAGNGGSAAIASHVAAEFLGKCIHDRHPLPAISLAESHSSLTAIGNDYGFDQVFLRGVQALQHRRALAVGRELGQPVVDVRARVVAQDDHRVDVARVLEITRGPHRSTSPNTKS